MEEEDEVIPNFEDANTTYLQFIEAQGGKGIDMLSAEGVALQAAYLKELGNQQHPFDIARRLSLNPFAAPQVRLNACKLLLEYMARKIPATMELSGPNGTPLSVNSDQLKKLTSTELDVLLSLLEKANRT
jgi:hypothetical protein